MMSNGDMLTLLASSDTCMLQQTASVPGSATSELVSGQR